MINILLKGRIGNNLFQIATGASLAAKHNSDFQVFPGDYFAPYPDNCNLADYLKQFGDNILKNTKINIHQPKYSVLYQEQDFAYEEIKYIDNMMIEGFFQSEKYFNENVVRDLFEIDTCTKAYINNKYGSLFDHEVTSINVRRGDYFKALDNHPICSKKYFMNAIKQIGKESLFLVISDDISWCKKIFKGDNFLFIDDEPPIVDLFLQTYCTNNIISNSTFSWWGAWLNPNPNKIVIAPDPWFGVAYKDKDTRDLLPEKWIRIKNKMSLFLSLFGYYLWYDKRIRYYFETKIKKRI